MRADVKGRFMKRHPVALAALFIAIPAVYAGQIADWHQKQTAKSNVTQTRRFGENEPDNGISEIGIERTHCYGMCPVYTVVILKNGILHYTGEDYAPRKGRFSGTVSPWAFNQLARFIKESQFDKLADSYTASVTDNPTVLIEVVMNGKRKVVSDYARSGPAKLWAIQQLTDDLVAQTKWDKRKAKSKTKSKSKSKAATTR